jgi:hypothetical protein
VAAVTLVAVATVVTLGPRRPFALATLGLIALQGCKRKPAEEPIVVPPGLALDEATHHNRHLLAGIGSAGALGRFLDHSEAPLDELTARQTECSRYLVAGTAPTTWTQRDVFSASPSAATGAGIPGPLVGDGASVWVGVEPAERLMARILDPSSFATCCEQNPTQCSPFYVAQIHTGEGHVYWTSDNPTVWHRGAAVHGAFGFEVAANPYTSTGCGPWQHLPPEAEDGLFMVSVSNMTFSERTARADAIAKAQAQATRWLRERGESESMISGMREERWCVDSIPGGQSGDQFLVHLLAYLPAPS